MDSVANSRESASGAMGAEPPPPEQSYGAGGCALKRLFLKE
jgi:hypothetical protein